MTERNTTAHAAEVPESMLAKVRALLAKAESSEFPAEAEAFTAKAAELMARYGIEQAMFADSNPGTDTPGDKIITIPNPWGPEKARLVYWIADAMRCRALLLPKADGGSRVHMFGYASDLERVDLLYTSLLLQMTGQLSRVRVPFGDSPRAYRRSWLLGFVTEVTRRVAEAERRARQEAEMQRPAGTAQTGASGRSTALVLADRAAVVDQSFAEAYPRTRKQRTSFTGSGYGAGRSAGATADIGQSRIGSRSAGALPGGR